MATDGADASGVHRLGTDDPPPGTPWRRSAKALLLDATGRLLLLHMSDPAVAAGRSWWELPGGGLEPGEDEVDAVCREVAEETGYRLVRDDVSAALWTRTATFTWLGTRRWQAETVHVVRLAPDAVADDVRLTDEESSALLGSGWWTLAEIERAAREDGVEFYPRRIAELGPAVLAGRAVDEGFERWS